MGDNLCIQMISHCVDDILKEVIALFPLKGDERVS